jgi:hypothetical protein
MWFPQILDKRPFVTFLMLLYLFTVTKNLRMPTTEAAVIDDIKFHLLCTVIFTQVTALVFSGTNGKLPYFPIEISRTASSSPNAYAVLLAGMLTMSYHIYALYRVTGVLDKPLLFVWSGACMLAIFDDVSNWSLHMVGVFAMVGGGIYIILNNDTQNVSVNVRSLYCVCAVSVYLIRFLLKSVAVIGFESDVTEAVWTPSTWFSFITESALRKTLVEKTLNIMYNGATVCLYPEYTLPLFKASGVLQWVFFYLLVEVVLVGKTN